MIAPSSHEFATVQTLTDHHGRRLILQRIVGRGGFGEVYEASVHTSTGLSRRVAVKLLRADLNDSDDALLRLNDEAQLLTHLRHPVVVGVEDLVKLGERTALISEYIDGCDLSAAMPMPPRAALQVVSKVAEALAAAWDQRGPDGQPLRIVHRDIKPGNIRLGPHGVVKLLDFGIARSETMVRAAKTGTGMMIGSMGYMAPERWLGRPDSHPGDVFALGCVLYAALAGQPLYRDMAPAAQVGTCIDAERLESFVEGRLSDLPREASRGLSLLRDMLAHDPDARPTASQVASRALSLAGRCRGQSLLEWSVRLEGVNQASPSDRIDSSWIEGPDGFRQVGQAHDSSAQTLEAPRVLASSEAPTERSPASRRRVGALLALVGGGGLLLALFLALIGVAGGALFAFGGAELGGVVWPEPEPEAPSSSAVIEPAAGVEVRPLDSPVDEARQPQPQPQAAPPQPDPQPDPPATTPSPSAPGAATPDSSGAPRRTSPAFDDPTGSPGAPALSEPEPPAIEQVAAPAGEVQVDSAVPVRLKGPDGLAEPGRVPEGRYSVQASFAHGAWTDTVTIRVAEGETVRVRCDQRFRRCRELP